MLTCWSTDLRLNCGSHHHCHQQQSHLFIIPRKESKLSLPFGLSLFLSSSSLAASNHFLNFLWASLVTAHTVKPPCLTYYENHLTWLESSLIVPLKFLALIERSWLLLTQSCLPPQTNKEPSDLSGLNLGSPPWFAFGYCSRSPAYPPDYHENHLIWVESILIVPLGFHSASLLNSPLRFWDFVNVDSACFILCINCIFCVIVSSILLLFDFFLITVFLILVMYSRFFDPETC